MIRHSCSIWSIARLYRSSMRMHFSLSFSLVSFSHCVRPRNTRTVPLIEWLQLINYQLAIFPLRTNAQHVFYFWPRPLVHAWIIQKLRSRNSQVEINKNSRSRNFQSRNERLLQTNYCSRMLPMQYSRIRNKLMERDAILLLLIIIPRTTSKAIPLSFILCNIV